MVLLVTLLTLHPVISNSGNHCGHLKMAINSSSKILHSELMKLQQQPLEGFAIRLVDDSNLFDWHVALFGPPNTLYEGGYFKVCSNTVGCWIQLSANNK